MAQFCHIFSTTNKILFLSYYIFKTKIIFNKILKRNYKLWKIIIYKEMDFLE